MYHRIKHIIPFFSVLVIISLISFAYQLLDRKHIRSYQFEVVTKNAGQQKEVYAVTNKNDVVDASEHYYFKDFILIGDTTGILEIKMKSDGKVFLIPLENLIPRDTFLHFKEIVKRNGNPIRVYSLHENFKRERSLLPIFNQFLNWNGDAELFLQLLKHPLFIYFLLFAFFYFIANRLQWNLKEKNRDFTINIPYLNIWIWIPFLVLTALIFVSERYYFLQDDNYAQFTPTIIHGLEGWYQQGTFPTYNPLQLGGVPTFTYSTYAFLYPITHCSYWIASFLFQDNWQFNNVFAVIHFAIGYYFLNRIFNYFKINPLIAMVGALSFIFCGFNLEASRSWYYVAPTIAFLPLLLHRLLIIGKNPFRIKDKFFFLFFLTIFAYSGNFQYWLYTLAFLLLINFLLQWEKKIQCIKNWLLILFGVLILYAPQLLTTYFALQGLDRAGGEGQGIWEGIGSLFFPFVFNDALPNGWGSPLYSKVSGYFYYGGSFFVLGFLLFCSFWMIRNTRMQSWFADIWLLRVFIFLTLFSLLFAIGRPGLLWLLQSKLPLLNKFNHPFKFLMFVQFFMIISGVLILQQFLKKYGNRTLSHGIAIFSFLLLAFQVTQTKDAFFVYPLQNKPYTKPPFLHIFNNKNDYRILSLSPSRSLDPYFSNSLTMNFATPAGIASFDGYEPMFQTPYNLYKHHRQAGIRYFLETKYMESNPYFIGLKGQTFLFDGVNTFQKVYDDTAVTIWEDSLYEPIVQAFNKEGARLSENFSIHNRNNGVSIDFEATNSISRLILGYHDHHNLKVFCNRKRIPYTRDAFNRIVITVPEKTVLVQLVYPAFVFGKKD